MNIQTAVASELSGLTDVFLDAIAGITDAELAADSALPGWTRAHLLSHVHFNAEALRRLTRWAVTGVEQRMYANVEERQAQIEDGATWPRQRLCAAVEESARALSAELDALGPRALAAVVVTAQGRSVPASEISWMRCREVGVHAVDLDRGVTFEDLPASFISRLIHDIATKRSGSSQAPALAAWLSGRTPVAPDLTPWL